LPKGHIFRFLEIRMMISSGRIHPIVFVVEIQCILSDAKSREGKVIPVKGRPIGFETSRIPHFLDSRLTDGREIVSLMRRPHFVLLKIPGTHF
jgi:hypothetical protein